MNDCTNPQAPNTTIPHLLPYLLIKDRSIEDVLGELCAKKEALEGFLRLIRVLFADPTIPQSSLVRTCVMPFEMNTQDFGFSILYAHLDAVRNFCKNLNQYRRNAKLVLNDQSRLDPLLEEAFR
jgi:SH2 domain-containing protein 3C